MEASENKNEYAGHGVANTSLALGATALGLTLLQNGSLGGLLGGNRPPVGEPPWSRDMNYERDLTQKDMEIGKLQAQLYTDQQITALRQELQAGQAAQAVINAQQNGVLSVLQSQVTQLNAMTSLFIKQPVMAASEAALQAFRAPAAATTAATGSGN